MSAYIGHIAAIATSVAWSFTSVFFTLSGKKVGSTVVNRTRLLFAVLLVMIMHTITQGQPIPLKAESFRWGWLALSGLIGFVIGDSFLFQAFVMIGPRLSMLLMALAPVFSTIFGWMFLRETLATQELIGIMVTIAGVALVIFDRQPAKPATQDENVPRRGVGILFGLGAALGQAGGLTASKLGLVGNFPALSGSLIRLITATIIIWIITVATRQIKPSLDKLRLNPPAVWGILGGAVTGPFIGVWLSLIAVQRAPLGIAATLTSLAPIFLIPISYAMFNDRIGRRAIIGTVAAIGGTALLFL